MKHQKSSIPYLFLLAAILIGLPVLDLQVQSEHKLNIEVVPIHEEVQYVESDLPIHPVPMLTAVYK